MISLQRPYLDRTFTAFSNLHFLSFAVQVVALKAAPFSALVKCSLTQTRPEEQQTIIISIPIEDRLSTIKDLREKITTKVLGLLKLQVGPHVKMLTFDLFWGNNMCKPDQELEYFMPLHQLLVFRAEMNYINPPYQHHWELEQEKAKSQAQWFMFDAKTLTGETVPLIASAAHRIDDVKIMIQETEGGWSVSCVFLFLSSTT